MNWYLGVLKKYAVFSGRARRMEFWMFTLINIIVSIILTCIDVFVGTAVLGMLYSLAVLIPSLAVTARRLHDTDRSGWWILISFIPAIGLIVLLVFMVLESQPGSNRFGDNPIENAA